MRKTAQQVVDLGSRRGGEYATGYALCIVHDGAALLQHVLAYGEAYPLLLFVADEGKVRVEKIVGGFACACIHVLDDVDEHVREGVARHGTVGAALHLEVDKEAAVAAENRKRSE